MYHLKGHLFKLALSNNLTYGRRLEKDEMASDVLCDSVAMSYLWVKKDTT
jgi:hypothetical protein